MLEGTGGQEALRLARSSLSTGTLQTYGSSWAKFERFCVQEGQEALEKMTDVGFLARFLGAMHEGPERPIASSTLPGYLAAIRRVADDLGYPRPEHGLLTAVCTGLNKLSRTRQQVRIPVEAKDIITLCEYTRSAVAMRMTANRAALIQMTAACLLGFVCMFRRSTMKQLETVDLELRGDYLSVMIRYEKRQPLKRQLKIRGYAFKWFQEHQRWLSRPKPFDEAKALHGADIQRWLLLLLERANITPPAGMLYEWHSLRSGGCTAAYFAGVEMMTIRHHGGWKDDRTIQDHYVNFNHVCHEADRQLMAFLKPG
mmetsp:Transcript_8498/g.25540  ORF Transcript_8498/g.25540 Transcript_8498/m.25540 type:complete len:313 (+) Transcript_8498:2009-2947(+)